MSISHPSFELLLPSLITNRDPLIGSSARLAQGQCGGSEVCLAMSQLCPPASWGSELSRSSCGTPMPLAQPDGYVNEEW